MTKILDRYLLREAFWAFLAVTLVLLAIILAHRFSRYLGEAASGNLPGDAVFGLLGFTSVGFLTVLLPVGLFLGFLMAFGRLYRDSEMSALFACGIGPRELYRPVMALAVVAALLAGAFSLYLAPWAAGEALKTRRVAEKEAEIGVFESGRFKTSSGGDVAFYAESVNSDDGTLRGVFVHSGGKDAVPVTVRAASGTQTVNRETGQRFLMMQDGVRYDGEPGSADFRITRFARHGMEIRRGELDLSTVNRDVVPTANLWGSNDPRDAAELQWRLSVPLVVLLLAFIAVPLSKTQPREGRYGRLIIGILIYVVYSNLLGVAQVWVERGKLPAVIGLWWVHLLMLAAGVFLLARMNGWRWRRPLRSAAA